MESCFPEVGKYSMSATFKQVSRAPYFRPCSHVTRHSLKICGSAASKAYIHTAYAGRNNVYWLLCYVKFHEGASIPVKSYVKMRLWLFRPTHHLLGAVCTGSSNRVQGVNRVSLELTIIYNTSSTANSSIISPSRYVLSTYRFAFTRSEFRPLFHFRQRLLLPLQLISSQGDLEQTSAFLKAEKITMNKNSAEDSWS